MPERKVTTDHEVIRQWIEARGGRPATVRGTGGDSKAGVLRVDFPGHKAARVEPLSWEEFFSKFDEKRLAFLYQENTSQGMKSRFCRFARRENVGIEGQHPGRSSSGDPLTEKPEEPSVQPEEESRWEGESPSAAVPPFI